MADDAAVASSVSLPLAERFAHASWKVRAAAYGEVAAGGAHPDAECAPLMASAVADSNAPAQERALDALNALLARGGGASGALAGCAAPLVKKAFVGRPKSSALAVAACGALASSGQGEAVLAALMGGYTHRVPKVALASVRALKACVEAGLGRDASVAKALPGVLEHKDGAVRAAAREVVALLGSKGDADGALRAALRKKLREGTMAEVEALLAPNGAPADDSKAGVRAAGVSRGAAVVRPRTAGPGGRADKGKASTAAPDAAAPAAAEVDDAAYQAAAPVDIMPELEKQHFGDDSLQLFEALESRKWTDKRAALQAVKRTCATNLRLGGRGYFDLVRAVKSLMADSNVAIVTEAASTVTALARGLRADFAQHARQLLGTMVDKLKEKNTGVTRALKEALAAVSLYSLPLAEVAEDAARGLAHKVPKVRAETAGWICGVAETEPVAKLTKGLPELAPRLVKMVGDADAAAREAALQALAAMQRAAGDRAMHKYLGKLDAKQAGKLTKLVSGDVGSGDATRDDPLGARVGGTKAPAARPKTAPSKTPARSKVARGGKAVSAPSTSEVAPAADSTVAAGMSKEVALAAAEELVDEKTMAKLASAEWKTRVEGVAAVQRLVDALEGDSLKAAAEPIVHLLAHRVCTPGEKVFQISKAAMECIGALAAREDAGCTRGMARVAVGVMAPRVADVKLKAPVAAALDALCMAVGPDFVVLELADKCKPNKNVKVVAEMVAYAATAVHDYGAAAFPRLPKVVALTKEMLQATAPAVKAAARQLCCSLCRWVGATTLTAQLGGIKPATLKELKAALAKVEHDPEATPVKKARRSAGARKAKKAAAVAAVTAGGPEPSAETTEPDTVAEDDDAPRQDISPSLGPIVSGLGSAAWKERGAALDRLASLVAGAGGRVAAAGTNAAFEAIKPVLADSNKMLIIRALKNLGLLVGAVGREAAREGRSCMRATVKCLNDPKSAVRDAAVRCLDCWSDAVGLTPMLASIAGGASRTATSGAVLPAEGRAAVMGFAARRMLTAGAAAVRSSETASALLKPACDAIGDKNPTVRAAGEALGAALVATCDHKAIHAAAAGNDKHNAVVTKLLAKAGGGTAESARTPSRRPRTAGARTPGRHGRTPKTPRTTAKQSVAAPTGAFLTMPANGKAKAARALAAPSSAEWRPAPGDGAARIEALQKEVEQAGVARDDMLALLFADAPRERAAASAALASTAAAGGLLAAEIVASMDLLLRWIASELSGDAERGADAAAALPALMAVLDAAREQTYTLNSVDAAVLLPALLEAGASDEAVAEGCLAAIEATCSVHPPSRVFALLVEGATAVQTAAGKARALAAMAAIAQQMGRSRAQLAFASLPALAPLLADADAAVRGAALAFWGRAYNLVGDDVWQYAGELAEPQKELLQDKLAWVKRQAERDAAAAARSPEAAAGRAPAVATPQGLKTHAYGATAEPGAPGTPQHPASVRVTAEEIMPDWERALALLVPQSVAAGAAPTIEGLKLAIHAIELADRMANPVLCAALAADADALVCCLSTALPALLSEASSSCGAPAARQAQALKPVKYLLNTLMKAFSLPSMARAVPEPSLRDLLAALLRALLDARLASLSDGVIVLQALNMLVITVLEAVDHTDSLCALLALLQQHRGAGAQKQRHAGAGAEGAADADTAAFADLVVRCLVKLTKALPATVGDLDLPCVLLSVHGYLMAFSVDELRSLAAQHSRPLRMVKTLLHELVVLKGEAIHDALTMVPHGDGVAPVPEVVRHIALNLSALRQAGAGAMNAGAAEAHETVTGSQAATATARAGLSERPPGAENRSPNPGLAGTPDGAPRASAKQAAASPAPAPASASSPTPAEIKSELASIFKQIGNKATTSEGLERLYRFTVRHPAVDIAPHLKKTSAAFRQYIQQGLARAAERARRASKAESKAALAEAATRPSAATASASAAEGYQARMDALRSGHAPAAVAAAAAAPAAPAAPAAAPKTPGAAADVDDLRARMRSFGGGNAPKTPGASAAGGIADLRARLATLGR